MELDQTAWLFRGKAVVRHLPLLSADTEGTSTGYNSHDRAEVTCM